LHRLRLMGLKLDNGTWTGGGTAAHRSTEIAPRPPEPQPTEQRKQVTVLFADLAGLSALYEGADAEEMGETLGALWRRVDGVVEEHGGVVDKHVGDTLLALWGAREAREDDPERAVRAALAMQAAASEFVVKEMGARAGANGALAPAGAVAQPVPAAAVGAAATADGSGQQQQGPLRIGISTGLVLLGGSAGAMTATGDAVQVASRLQQAAPVGAVLLSHDTYRHVRGVFSVHPPETMRLEGRAHPLEVYRVKRAKPRAFRVQTRGVEGVETRTVGREGEMRQLMGAVETVFEERELQVVTVLADAGVGKSRLLYDISNWVELRPDLWYVFNGRAGESMQALPYSLVRDVFSYRFEIQDSDSPSVARRKLEEGLLAMSGAGEGSVAAEEVRMRAHFIGQLIGFDFSESRHLSGILEDARQIRDRAFHYAGQFFADVTRSYPAVLYLDDIHWADDGSLDFVDYLARNCSRAPMFVLCLARPSLLERRPAWGEGQENHTRLRLQPLSKRESRQLVGEILRRARGVPSELRELIVGGAEGNPFYVEELIKMLIDQRVIVTGAEEWTVDASRLGQVQVPPTLTGVLQARLDKLTQTEKAVLQRASVVGRVFWDGAVRDLGAKLTGAIRRETVLDSPGREGGPSSDGVTEVLESLRRKELIYRREASSFAGAIEYTFKHALLRDVTYESVLRRERREYHRRAAEWLARHSGGRAGEYAGVVAEHYERAQDSAAAADWYGRAGRQARETYAPETAIKFYRKALEFLPAGAGAGDEASRLARRVEWNEGLGEVLRVQARYAEAVEAYAAMRAAAEASGDNVAQARAWNETALVRSSQGDIRATYESTQHAEALARTAGESAEAREELARALNLQSQASSRLGDSRAAMMLADRALVISTELGEAGRRVRADSLKSLGMAYHMVGRFEEADRYKEQALQMFRELEDRLRVGNLLNSLGETARLRGDYRAAFARYQEALAIAREVGNRNGEILYFSNLGGARVGLGEHEAAEADLRQAIEMGASAGYIGLSENYRFLAESLAGQGRLDEALEAALRALELGREVDNQEHVGEAWRALGLVASRRGAAVEVGGERYDAGRCFAESVGVFERINMEAEHARTLRDWARHELAHGDRDEARRLWQRALDTFTRLRMTLEVERMAEEGRN
ncbi:MAG TPA: tetratricopeptide repeat protein, partial [Pyrinomonadaceae bacterium]|nr:tetratricopeptide repeat protein [Pyrinomonadaceae bacterium]